MTDLSPFLSPVHAVRLRIAVLVDGDNFPHSDLHRLEAVAADFGDVVIRRVYADMRNVGGWHGAAGYQTLHCDTAAGKKNLADMHLTVAAMDVAQRGLASGFVVASDDRDFEPLLQFLTETGRKVLRLRKSVVMAPPPKPICAAAVVDQALVALLKAHPKGMTLVAIGAQLRCGTVKAQTGHKTWRGYFASQADRYVMEGAGQATVVRLRKA